MASSSPTKQPRYSSKVLPAEEFRYKENVEQLLDDRIKKAKDTHVIGDSCTKYISCRDLSAATGCNVYKTSCCYMIRNAKEAVGKTQAPSIIIHCGTNNANKQRAHQTITELRYLESAIRDNKRIKNVTFSSLLRRSDSYDADYNTELINAAIKTMCEENGWQFINNDNIRFECLDDRDGYHPNRMTSQYISRISGHCSSSFTQDQLQAKM